LPMSALAGSSPSASLSQVRVEAMEATKPAYEHDLPAIGDIILCRGTHKSSTWNVLGQQAVRWRRLARYSHVAVQMWGFVLHAMPKKGVHAHSTLALLSEQRDW